MSEPKFDTLLEQGGISAKDLDGIFAGVEGRHPRFDALRDPGATEELARALAAELAPLAPTRLLLWADEDDSLLAFIVARELNSEVTTVRNAEGLLDISARITSSDRVAIVAESFRSSDRLQSMRSFVALQGATLVAVATLIDTAFLRAESSDQEKVIALISPEPPSGR